MNDDDLKFLSEVKARLASLIEVGTAERWEFQNGQVFSISGPSYHPNACYRTIAIVCDDDQEVGAFVAGSFTDIARLVCLVQEQDKRARHAEQERDAFNARIDELEAEVTLAKEERDAVLEECDGCKRLAHLTPTHVPPIRTDRGSKWLCGLCLLSSFRALETQLVNRKSVPTRKDIALALLRGIGPNPAEFMAMGKDAFLGLADRLIEMFNDESKVGKDKP